MTTINTPTCFVGGANTGIPACLLAPDKIVGAILIDRSKSFTDEEAADIIAELQELALLTGRERIYPVFRFDEIADSSEEEVVVSLGYGSKQVARDGKYDWTFRMLNSGLCLQSKLRAFNKAKMKVLFVDSNNIIFGTRTPAGEITGFSLDFFYAKPFKIADGSNSSIFQVRFALSKPAEFNDNVVFLNPGVDVEEAVKGIIDVELFEIAKVAGKATVGVRTQCDKVNIFDSFSDALAAGALWSVTKAGATVSITSVVKNTTANGWDISFTGTGEHVINLASTEDLATANVGGAPDNGYESTGGITVTMPAP